MSNKHRLLLLLRYLQEHTDDNCCVSSAQLQSYLAERGVVASVRTIRDDIAIISDAGYDVIVDEHNGFATQYHIGERVFEKPELQILIDAVSSAKFISQAKSQRLIQKLVSLGNVSDMPLLSSHKMVAQKVKSDNASLYYVIEVIDQAITQHKRITFQYEKYNHHLKKELRHDGELYCISPWGRVWSDDRYYMVGWSDKHNKTVSFRIDLMRLPAISDLDAETKPPSFDLSDYSTSIIKMFDGEIQKVILSCTNDLATKLVDRFGLDGIRIIRREESTFWAEVSIAVTPTFFGWLLQYGNRIRIISPDSAKEKFCQLLSEAYEGLNQDI